MTIDDITDKFDEWASKGNESIREFIRTMNTEDKKALWNEIYNEMFNDDQELNKDNIQLKSTSDPFFEDEEESFF